MNPETFSYIAERRRLYRKERIILIGGVIAVIALPCLTAWAVVGWLLGTP